MPWRHIPIRFTEKSRRATRSWNLWSQTCSGRPAAKLSCSSERKRSGVIGKAEIVKQWSLEGTWTKGETCAFKHADQKSKKGKRKQATADAKSNAQTRTGTSPVRKTRSLPSFSYKKVAVKKTRVATSGILRSLFFMKKTQCRSGTTCPFVHIPKDTSRRVPHVSQSQTEMI